jgi:shikimate dehydrogenase
MADNRTRLAVLGSPIAHSQSPAIHRAAYGLLGLPWSYDAQEITGESLAGYVRSLDGSWRGLSLTMPLKRDILPLLDRRDSLVDLVGGANTVLMTDDGLSGFNTDVYGVERSFRDAGVASLDSVHLLGSGATAASVLAGAARLGATRALVSARTPANAAPLEQLGEKLGIEVTVRRWGVADRSLSAPDAVISTVPGGSNDLVFPEEVRAQSVLFDVAYDPWPSQSARQWMDVGGTVISGLDLLVNQAVGQIRIFVSGDPTRALHREDEVVAAMRAAVWKD